MNMPLHIVSIVGGPEKDRVYQRLSPSRPSPALRADESYVGLSPSVVVVVGRLVAEVIDYLNRSRRFCGCGKGFQELITSLVKQGNGGHVKSCPAVRLSSQDA